MHRVLLLHVRAPLLTPAVLRAHTRATHIRHHASDFSFVALRPDRQVLLQARPADRPAFLRGLTHSFCAAWSTKRLAVVPRANPFALNEFGALSSLAQSM